jgi:hypothetical protein
MEHVNEGMRTFDTLDAYFKDEMLQLERMFRMPVTDVDRKLGVTENQSRKMPEKYPQLTRRDNLKRLQELSKKITNDSASKAEWKEYGWRMKL